MKVGGGWEQDGQGQEWFLSVFHFMSFFSFKKTLKFEIIIDSRNVNKTRTEILHVLYPFSPVLPSYVTRVRHRQQDTNDAELWIPPALLRSCLGVCTLPCSSVVCTLMSPPPRSTAELFHPQASLGLPQIPPSADNHGSVLALHNCVILRLLHKWNHRVYNPWDWLFPAHQKFSWEPSTRLRVSAAPSLWPLSRVFRGMDVPDS